MKPMFFVDRYGQEWTADVPDDAVPFGIGATCPICAPDGAPNHGARVVESIDYTACVYACAPQSREATSPALAKTHSPLPHFTIEVRERRDVPQITITGPIGPERMFMRKTETQ